ncbi:MAG: phytanoyl-CoA dioxygenase family protein [Alphaproteobacteria bacterium]|nr:phytanoyl-CoA dioxygenase family protein [Alphaproteobacteria bacterium]
MKHNSYPLRWQDEDLPGPTQHLETLCADLERFGYCIVERALEENSLRAVQDRLVEQASVERKMHSMKNPANTDPVNQWVGMLLNKGDIFFELIEHEIYCALVEHLIGPDYQISCVDAQIQHPGAGTMPLHTDQWWMPQPVLPGERNPKLSAMTRGAGTCLNPAPADRPIAPAAVVNAMWMITDFSEETGATRIVPMSHLSGQEPDASVPHKVPTVPAAGPAGTAIVFDARLWHGAAPNTSNQSRFGVTTVACGPQFRALENYSRGLRPDVFARNSSERVQRLGFATWSSYGHTGDPEAQISAGSSDVTGELYST